MHKREERERTKNQKRYQIIKNILEKDGLERVPTHGITGLENCSQGMKRMLRTILDWYSSLVVSLSIER